MLGYTKSAVSNWENGVSVPRMKDAFILSKILEKEVDYLFFNQKEQDSHTSASTA